MVVLSAAENAAESMGLITILGKAKIGDAEVVRPARPASMIWGGQFNQLAPRYRLARNFAVAVSGYETAPFALDAGGNAVVEMCKAGKARRAGQAGASRRFQGQRRAHSVIVAAERQARYRQYRRCQGRRAIWRSAWHRTRRSARTRSRLSGHTQVSYSRDPEAVKAATDRKAAVDKIVADLAAAAKAATEAKAAAEKKAADMTGRDAESDRGGQSGREGSSRSRRQGQSRRRRQGGRGESRR